MGLAGAILLRWIPRPSPRMRDVQAALVVYGQVFQAPGRQAVDSLIEVSMAGGVMGYHVISVCRFLSSKDSSFIATIVDSAIPSPPQTFQAMTLLLREVLSSAR